jgi:hypothetical protein
LGRFRLRKAEEAPRFVCNVAEIDKAAGFAQEVEQIAMLAGRGIRPLAGI